MAETARRVGQTPGLQFVTAGLQDRNRLKIVRRPPSLEHREVRDVENPRAPAASASSTMAFPPNLTTMTEPENRWMYGRVSTSTEARRSGEKPDSEGACWSMSSSTALRGPHVLVDVGVAEVGGDDPRHAVALPQVHAEVQPPAGHVGS